MAKKCLKVENDPVRIIKQDCIAGMSGLAGAVDLVFADPPYNQGVDYTDYNDKQPAAVFLAWMKSWLLVMHKALKPTGSAWIMLPDEWVAEVDLYCRQTLKMHRRNWVIWTFTFGQAASKSFTRSHVHILYFTKKKEGFTFNVDALKVPSARQLVYKDKRAVGGGKLPDDTWALLKPQIESVIPDGADVWSQSRICGTFKERRKGQPNQVPLPILTRIIRACSNPGDIVLDPFVGSGSTAEACVRLDRQFVGFDVSEQCVNDAKERVSRVRAELAGTGPGQQQPLFKKDL